VRTRISRDLLIVFVGYAFLYAGTMGLQHYLYASFAAAYEWTALQNNLILLGLWSCILLTKVFVTHVIRVLGIKWSFLLGSATFVLFPLAAATGVWGIALVGACLWGFGCSLVFVVMGDCMLRETAPGSTGTVTSMFLVFMITGMLVGVTWIGNLGENLRLILLIAAGISAAGTAVFFFLRFAPVEHLVFKPRTLASVFVSPYIRYVGMTQFFSALAFGVIISPLVDVVMEKLGAQWLWVLLVSYYAARALGAVVGGRIVDRAGASTMLTGAFLLGAVCLALLPLVEGLWPMAALLGFFGLVQSGIPIGAIAVVGNHVDKQLKTTAFSAVFMYGDAAVILTLLSSQLVKTLLASTSYVFYGFAILYVVVAFLARRGPGSGPVRADGHKV